MLLFQHGVFYLCKSAGSVMTSTEEIYNYYLRSPGITIDSRNVIPNSIFFALNGDHFDGNQFAAEALEKKAAYAVIDDPSKMTGNRYILVPDTLRALQQLAGMHRSNIKAKIIGITGSNGKTTTKELIGRVLSSAFKTVITQGNLNNHIGVPLTILSLREDTAFAVVEMGANHPGEIAGLCRIARPEFGLITNIGKAHLEGFGSFEGVIKAKSELYDFIRQHNGLIFVNMDNQLLCTLSNGMRLSTYGSDKNAGCRGEIAERDPYLSVAWSRGPLNGLIRTKLCGDYNFENVMAALCIGLYFGISPEQIEQAVSDYNPENNRSQWIRSDRNVLILDAYNANPSSMKAALNNFHKIDAPSKTIILGDMMELGEYSLGEHREIIALVRKLFFSNVFVVGEIFSRAAYGGNEVCFANTNEAELWFRDHPLSGTTILIKGSRKMQLENLTNLF
jgi:UDP-N-acetylmuramoyl-tripeptide--D-alanyl-D-alanine ligase